MTNCWKPAWCECASCGPLVAVEALLEDEPQTSAALEAQRMIRTVLSKPSEALRRHDEAVAARTRAEVLEAFRALADEAERRHCRTQCGPDAHAGERCDLLLISPRDVLAALAHTPPDENPTIAERTADE